MMLGSDWMCRCGTMNSDIRSRCRFCLHFDPAKLESRANECVEQLDAIAAAVSNLRNPRSDNNSGRAAQVIEDLLYQINELETECQNWRKLDAAEKVDD